MKSVIFISILSYSILFLIPKNTKAQCHIDDWTALKALYESTDGDNWYNRDGWDMMIDNQGNPPINCNLDDLWGVHLNEDNRVFCLDMDHYSGAGFTACGYSGNFVPGNNLTGNIPSEIEKLIYLKELYLNSNKLTGNIPIEITYLNSLVYLWLSENRLGGIIMPEIANLSNLVELGLDENLLEGIIPIELSNLINLKKLNLSYNEINGNIPVELINLINLEELDLSANQLNGTIPSALGNLVKLKELILWSNELEGNIPSSLGNLLSLNELNLSNNDFTGNIPIEVGDLSNLEILRLSLNQLDGNIPSEFSNLTNLVTLSISYNEISGNIPNEIGNLSNLIGLFMNNNNLSGDIPLEIGNLTNLTNLQINDNNLEGCFPNNISVFCTQLTSSSFDGNSDISDGNNFDATWEDFCTIGAATCDGCEQDCESKVWPGDVNNDGIVNNQDDAIHYLYYNYNNNNIPREEQGIDWQPYTCPDWGFAVPEAYGNDIKHFDCDGNGDINNQDKNAILLNWGSTHNEANFQGASIYPFGIFPSDYKIYLQPTGNINNNLLIMNIALEHIGGEPLNLFGGFFTVDYGDTNANILNAVADFNISWLGIPNGNLNMDFKDFPEQKKIEVAFSRTDGSNAVGSGVIGQIAFTLDNTNQRQNGNSQNTYNTQIVEFDAINVGAHNNMGNPISISNQYLPVNIGNVNCEQFITINQATPFQNLYKSSGTITTNNDIIVGQDQQVTYNANQVRLNRGFSVRAGADFKVRSNGCN